jgi:exosortase A
MTAILPIRRATAGAGTWGAHLAALGIVAASILALFHRDALDMASMWLGSSTFNHCSLILPIICWLVVQRLPELRQLSPSAWAPGLLLIGAGAAGWLLGEAGSVALARHAGLVLMLQGAVIACLGRAVAQGLAFPLFYALFLIPAGEELIQPMQTLTAKMCMVLLDLVGIPANIDGVFITIPSGYFEVAEACSGVQFLIAMAAYGALVANVCFRSWTRRALFMAAAFVIPIVANGIRAWGTIYIAHLTTIEFAAGFDHVMYGWVFFAIVISLLMAGGWRFFDRRPGDPWLGPQVLQESAPARSSIGAISAAALTLAALPLVWSSALASAASEAPADIILPTVAGWQRVPGDAGRPWQPHFAGADLIRMGRYRNAAGHEVDLAIVLFARQEEGREIVAYGQGAAGPNSGWAWTASGDAPPRGRLDRIASFGTVREVATFYRVGSIVTGSNLAVKLETMKTRLFGGPQRAVAVLVSAPEPNARRAIRSFLLALEPIERIADRAAVLPQAAS